MADEVKIFEMNDCDWVAARSLDEAKAFYHEMGCDLYPEEDDPREVTAEQMQKLRFDATTDDDDPGEMRTFREQLDRMIARGCKFPLFFASTEY